MNSEPKIIQNAARCLKCNTIVNSKHRHDYNRCECGAIAVDGGGDYLKRNGSSSDAEELSLFENSTTEELHEKMIWGSYGKKGDEPLKYHKVKDLTTEHLKAILKTQEHIKDSIVKRIITKELRRRAIEDLNI